MTRHESFQVLEALSVPELERMGEAALRILECYRVLKKSETTVVAEMLRGAGEFVQWEHYPDDDVIDYENHSQYFYHAHSPEDRGHAWDDEHGHFHTFLRREGMPEGATPVSLPCDAGSGSEAQSNCHLIAISMNAGGQPTRLFTVNRWVTGDTWYDAGDAVGFVSRFRIDQALPSWPVNVWISEMTQLFRPQIEELLRERDATLSAWAAEHPGDNPYETGQLEILSATAISVERQALAVDAALKAKGRAGFVE